MQIRDFKILILVVNSEETKSTCRDGDLKHRSDFTLQTIFWVLLGDYWWIITGFAKQKTIGSSRDNFGS
jgi:hypothetical protein